MSNQTPLDDLLKIETDEVEESPDNPTPAPTAEAATSAPEVKAEGKTDPATPAATTQDQPQGDGEEVEHKRRMTALPKWAHERLSANNEKAAASERARIAAEQAAEARAARIVELETYIQNNGHSPPEQQEADPRQEFQQAIWETKKELGWERAVEKHGQEMPSQATHWANDKAQSDPDFGKRLWLAADPVGFSIREFKKAQAADELDKHGWDLDALVKARAPQPAVQTQPTAQTQPAAVVTKGASPTPASPLPSDFASAPSGGGRTAPVFAGPTPLGQLLNQKRG